MSNVYGVTGKNPDKSIKYPIKIEYNNLEFGSENLLSGFPQGNNSSISYTDKAFYVNLTPSSTAIVNKDILDNGTWTIKNGIEFNLEFGYFMKLSQIMSLGAGLGFSSYTTEISSSPQQYPNPDTTDIDGDTYTPLIETTEITEKVSLRYLDIPLFIEFSNININKIGFYGRLGVKLSFPLSKTLNGSGYYSQEGYYQKYHVMLHDIPELGFTSDEQIYKGEEMALKPMNVSALLSAGITYPLSNHLIIRLGANANVGLLEVSNKKADDFEQTEFTGPYSKLLDNKNATTTTRSFGVEIGLIYNLSLY